MSEHEGYGGAFTGQQIDSAIQKSIDNINTKEFTQAEYDALSQAEQDSTLAIITDADPALSGGGGTAEEVYSTEEVRIGTWIDENGVKKPLYRRTYHAMMGEANGIKQVLGLSEPTHRVVWYNGFVGSYDDFLQIIPLGADSNVSGATIYAYFSWNTHEGFYVRFNQSVYAHLPIHIYAHYIKTTD